MEDAVLVFLKEVHKASGQLGLPVQFYFTDYPPDAELVSAALDLGLVIKSEGNDVMLGDFYEITLTRAGYAAIGATPPRNLLTIALGLLFGRTKRPFLAV